MKRITLILLALCFFLSGKSQSIESFFERNSEIIWLGVDFSHVKLIGNFSQFNEAGDVSPTTIKNSYFPKWNKIILDEREKYNLKEALQKDAIFFDINMITKINSESSIDSMEVQNVPNYTTAQIKQFIHIYPPQDKAAVGILFIAECLNKSSEEAYYHFVALNLENMEILVHERIKGSPSGIGLRNYWAGSMYSTIKSMKKSYKKAWKSKYL